MNASCPNTFLHIVYLLSIVRLILQIVLLTEAETHESMSNHATCDGGPGGVHGDRQKPHTIMTYKQKLHCALIFANPIHANLRVTRDEATNVI